MDTGKFLNAEDVELNNVVNDITLSFEELTFDEKMRITGRNKRNYIKFIKLDTDYTKTIEAYHKDSDHDIQTKKFQGEPTGKTVTIKYNDPNEILEDGYPRNSIFRIERGPNRGMIVDPTNSSLNFHKKIIPSGRGLLNISKDSKKKYQEIFRSNMLRVRGTKLGPSV